MRAASIRSGAGSDPAAPRPTDPRPSLFRTDATPTLAIRVSARFRRDPDIVRCHFLDIRHHLEHQVHEGVRYQILIEDHTRLRLSQEVTVLGMTKRDELVLYPTRDGRVIQEFLAGDFAGGDYQPGRWARAALAMARRSA